MMSNVVKGRWSSLDRSGLSSVYLSLALLIGLASTVGLVVLGDKTPASIATALVASAVAGLVVVLVPTRPLAAFGVLVLVASLSKFTIDLNVGRVRLEQPAIMAAIVALTLSRGWPRWSDVRPVALIIVAFAAYLGITTLSSILYAPQIATSARLLIWTAISMCGGVVAFALLVRANRSPEGWFTATGVLYAVVGLGIAAAYFLVAPDGLPGMQINQGEVPKVAGLAWEANLYASFLGAMAPFALEQLRNQRRLLWAIPAALIIVALGMGVTRGAYLGLAAGLGVYLLVVVARAGTARSSLRRVIAVVAIAAVLAPTSAIVLLPSQSPAYLANAYNALVKPAPSAIGSGNSPAPTAEPAPPADTLEWRFDRVPVAIGEARKSLIIGLGAASFGQRHEIPGQPGKPDYLAILALATVYESGLLGALALGVGLLLVFGMLFRASRDNLGRAAAFGGSLASLLVAYESTNALFFSINWLIIGAALAFTVTVLRRDTAQSPSPPEAIATPYGSP